MSVLDKVSLDDGAVGVRKVSLDEGEGRRRVAVLCGGASDERALSLQGGRDVAAALNARGHGAVVVDYTSDLDLAAALRGFAVVFLVLHGPLGEDGSVQGFLEVIKVPYTFSGVLTHAICVDKVRTKRYLRGCAGVRLVEDETVSKASPRTTLALPVMVKDPQSGSSRGVWKCDTAAEVAAAVGRCAAADVLVERFVVGVDLVVCVNAGDVLAEMEFRTKMDWQDLASKNALWGWDGAADAAPSAIETICPSTLPAAVVAEARAMALRVYEDLGGEGGLNVEFRVAGDDVYFIEVSSIPAMTKTSVHACCAAASGLDFEDVCERILRSARLKL